LYSCCGTLSGIEGRDLLLGALAYNLIIIFNLSAGRVSREKLDWDDQFVSAVRNSASVLSAKGKRAARRVSDADKAATRLRKERRRNTASPPLAQAA
jgi:hypothetical protein